MKILAWKLNKMMAENKIHRQVIDNKLSEIQEAFEVFYRNVYSKVPGGHVTKLIAI